MSACWRRVWLLVAQFLHVSGNGTGLLVLNALSSVFGLRVSCLGGPVIDAGDGDWILTPVPEVWRLTPSLLIASFTHATGLLRLQPHNPTFSLRLLSALLSLCCHMSGAAADERALAAGTCF